MTDLIIFLMGGFVGGLAGLIDDADDADTLLNVAVGAVERFILPGIPLEPSI